MTRTDIARIKARAAELKQEQAEIERPPETHTLHNGQQERRKRLPGTRLMPGMRPLQEILDKMAATVSLETLKDSLGLAVANRYRDVHGRQPARTQALVNVPGRETPVRMLVRHYSDEDMPLIQEVLAAMERTLPAGGTAVRTGTSRT